MGVSVAIYRCTDKFTVGVFTKLFSAPGKSGQGFTVFGNKNSLKIIILVVSLT